MLAAVPEIEERVVLRVDVDPDGEGGAGAQRLPVTMRSTQNSERFT